MDVVTSPPHARAGVGRRARRTVAVTGLTAVLLAAGGCSTEPAVRQAATVTVLPDTARAKIAPPAPVPPVTFTLAAAGDLLPHGPVVRSARDGARFGPLLAGLDPWVAGADLALCHMEVPVAPPGTAPSGYPSFAAPVGLVTALAGQGWDGCSTASNHSVDRGLPGVVATLDAFDAAGLGHVGTARSAAEQAEAQHYRLHRGGRTVVVAHLSATFGLNGLPVPADAPWAVDLIDARALTTGAERARQDGADVVLLSLHAGEEYTEVLTTQQVEVVSHLAASGAVDLVIGHHAHVPQQIRRVDGGPRGDGMWVAYGLGNLLSNQSSSCCDARTSNGVLLTATFTQQRPTAPTAITDMRWTATTVDVAGGHRVHALPDALRGDGPSTLSHAELATRRDLVAAAVGTDARRRAHPPAPTGDPPRVAPRTRPAAG